MKRWIFSKLTRRFEKTTTAKEFMDELESDDECQALLRKREVEQQRKIRDRDKEASAIIIELEEVGLQLPTIWQLNRAKFELQVGQRLIELWPSLRAVSLNEEFLQYLEGGTEHLAVREFFLSEFRNVGHPDHLRWKIGESIGNVITSFDVSDILGLVREEKWGTSRQMIVTIGFAKIRDPRVVEVLLELVEDPTVKMHAAGALGKQRDKRAIPILEEMIRTCESPVRIEARKALKRLK